MKKLEGKTVVIFGGTGGIGESVSFGLYAAEANLVIIGRNLEKLAKLKEKLSNSQKVIILSADASYLEEVEGVFSEALETFGCIDCVFISIGDWENNYETDDSKELNASRERLYKSMVLSARNICATAVKSFGEKGGVIFHVSSHVVYKPESELPGNHIYREMKIKAEEEVNSFAGPKVQVVNLRSGIVRTPKNVAILTRGGVDRRGDAVQPEEIAKWVVENFNNQSIPQVVNFESKVVV